jgi:hypothetical protein
MGSRCARRVSTCLLPDPVELHKIGNQWYLYYSLHYNPFVLTGGSSASQMGICVAAADLSPMARTRTLYSCPPIGGGSPKP